MSSNPQPKPVPKINLPKGDSTCELFAINSTCDIISIPLTLVEPEIKGHDWLNLPTVTFYIKHPRSGTQVIFDLGCRTDWQNLAPHVVDVISQRVPGLRVQKEVPDILKEGGVNPDELKALILSHWHFDHSGNISRLHPSTDLIVGPGFRDRLMPGYPAKQDSTMLETDFKGRNVIEAPFNDDYKVGGYQAHDYFGDGSLVILNVPGHTTGHISALVRTTPDTYAFLGGDVCHFTGVIRPSNFIPMPDPIPSITALDKRFPSPCPCSVFSECHPNPEKSRTSAYYRCSSDKSQSWYDDPVTAMDSIRTLFEFDAQPNVLVLIAHDTAPLATLDFFPHGNINDWRSKGWKESMHWFFLNELPFQGKAANMLTDGVYKDGKRVKTLTGEAV